MNNTGCSIVHLRNRPAQSARDTTCPRVYIYRVRGRHFFLDHLRHQGHRQRYLLQASPRIADGLRHGPRHWYPVLTLLASMVDSRRL